MAEQTEIIRLQLKIDEYSVKAQQAKDQIKELDKAIKELNKDSGARKDLIIEKAQAEKNLKDIQKEIKNYEKQVADSNKASKFSFMELWAGIQLGIGAFNKIVSSISVFKNAARDAVETNQKFKVVFSGVEQEAEKMSKSFAKAFDLSGVTAKKLLSDTGNLLIGFGMTEEAALKMSLSINTIAQDLVSFTNYSGGTEAAAQALTSAMTGNTRAAKSLGIVIRQENAEFKNRVKYLEENNGLTQQAATSTAIYEQIVQQTKKAQGDYARTSDQLANTERRRQEIQKEVSEQMGKQLIPIFTTWNNIAANFLKLLLPDEFKNVSTEIKAAHDRLIELRTQLQGLTKDQLEKKLKEVEEELAKIEKSATGANNVFQNYNDIVKENANALTLQSKIAEKYNLDLKDSIDLTAITTQKTDAFTGSNKLLDKQFSANAVSAFDLREQLTDLKAQIESLMNPTAPKTNVITDYYKLTDEQLKESDRIAQEIWDKEQKAYEERAKIVQEYAEEQEKAQKKIREEEQKTADKNAELTQKQIINGEKLIKEAEEQAQAKKQAQIDWTIQQAETTAAIFNELNRAEMQDIDNKYNSEKEKYAELLDQNKITKEEYDIAIQKLDNKAAKEKKKILKQQQIIDIAIATISTAKGVMSAFSAKDNVVTWQMWTQAALAAALGAAQIATIKKQKFARGGMLDGPSHEQGGIVAGNVEFEGGEGVVNKTAMRNPYLRQIVSNVNQAAGGGVAFSGTSKYRAGGVASFSGASTSRIERLLEALNANVGGLDLSVAVNNSSNSNIDRITSEVTKRQNRFVNKGGVLADI